MKPDYSAARTYALAQGPAGYGTRWNRGSGQHTVATVKKALITSMRHQWTVTVADGPDRDVKGNIVAVKPRSRKMQARGKAPRLLHRAVVPPEPVKP